MTAVLAVAVLAVYGIELAGGVEQTCLARGFDRSHPTLTGAVLSLFLHAGWLHVVGNLAVLLAAGSVVEREIGSARFTLLYFAAGLAGAAMHVAVDPSVLVGASGSLCGVLAVVAVLRPRWCGAVAGFMMWNIFLALSGTVDGTSFSAHIGGFTFGAVAVLSARLLSAQAFSAARLA